MASLKTYTFEKTRKIEVGKTYQLTSEHECGALTIKSIWSDRYGVLIDVVDAQGKKGEAYPNSLYYQIEWQAA